MGGGGLASEAPLPHTLKQLHFDIFNLNEQFKMIIEVELYWFRSHFICIARLLCHPFYLPTFEKIAVGQAWLSYVSTINV